MDIKDKNPVGVQPGRPQVAAVIRQSRVMGLVTAAHREGVDYLAVIFRLRIDVNGNQLVLFVPKTLHAQRPDIDEILLADDFRHVRRHAGLVGGGKGRD